MKAGYLCQEGSVVDLTDTCVGEIHKILPSCRLEQDDTLQVYFDVFKDPGNVPGVLGERRTTLKRHGTNIGGGSNPRCTDAGWFIKTIIWLCLSISVLMEQCRVYAGTLRGDSTQTHHTRVQKSVHMENVVQLQCRENTPVVFAVTAKRNIQVQTGNDASQEQNV